ncbi:MAG: class I SAM-dependent methyltransferase, partial [Caldilinea sp.]
MTNESRTFSPNSIDHAQAEKAAYPGAVDFMLSPAAQPVLDQLAHEALDDAHVLALLTKLRRIFPAAIAGELVAQARLRQRASVKFPEADRMFFVAEALEQATAQAPAEHRADQFDSLAPAGVFLDLGCGIGGDLIALARRRPVIAYEIDPVRGRFAQANAAALGLAGRVTVCVGDWTAALAEGTLPQAAAAFVDPARRSEGRRTFSLHAMKPPLAEILKLRAQTPFVAVKVMPGVSDDELP